MYNAKVYKIMFGSPSDIVDERNIFFNIVHGWNHLHSEKNEIVLLPLHWSKDSYPLTGKHAQKIIDDVVVAKSDLLICVFGSKLGTNTDTHISGTVEEIDEHIKAGKDVMVYFKKSLNIDPDSFDFSQLEKLKAFKESIKNKCKYSEFKDSQEFKDELSKDLQLYINAHWMYSSIKTENEDHSMKQLPRHIELSDFDLERLKAWTSVDNPEFFQVHFEGGGCIYGLGVSNQYEIRTGKEKIEWNDFFERMMQHGFIDIERYDKYGQPIYRLKKAANDYVSSLNENN